MSDERVTLSKEKGGQLTYPITEEQATDIEPGYRYVTVHDGVWIFYKNNQFGGPGGTMYRILKKGEHDVHVDFDVGSCRRLEESNDGIILFEHMTYGGKMMLYTEDNRNITPGASSAIILSGTTWLLFIKTNFKGSAVTIDQNTENFVSLGINDQVKSIQRK